MFSKFKAYAIRNPFMVSTGALALLGGCTIGFSNTPATATNFNGLSNAPVEKVIEIRPTAKVVDLSYMNNVKLGGLAGAYFGEVRRDEAGNVLPLPDKMKIDFTDNLENLWDKKLNIKGVSGAARKSAQMVVDRYENSDPEYKGIKTFVREVDAQAELAHKSIDFAGFCGKMRLKPVQCSTLRKVTGNIRGKQLVAYGMTEVMPTWDGEVNYLMLDTLLRNAGENYIQSIPALGDKLMSLGFYQFTSYAVQDGENTEGASVVNRFVTHQEAKIPGSVSDLKGDDHHRAAFYFVTYNMGRLMRKLNERDAALLTSGRCGVTSLTQFIATAHHMPTRAIDKAHDWIKGGCSRPITDYMGDHLTEYATKTKNNLESLNRFV